jgi:hypothetical protein
MSRLESLRDGLTDPALRFAIVTGLLSVPPTILLSWYPYGQENPFAGATVDGLPLLVAGVVVGYRYSQRSASVRRAGIWTGLAGSAGTCVVFVANGIVTATDAPPRLAAIAVALTPLSIALGVGLTVLVTSVTALVTAWIATRLARARDGRDRDPAGETSPLATHAEYLLAVYALVAPAVLASVFLGGPGEGARFFLTVLAMMGVVLLSVVVLVALFEDVTGPRWAGAGLPRVAFYVGGPVGAYGVVYAIATLRGSIHPPGDAVYGFVAALWLSVVLYLVDWRRNGTPG